MRGSLTVGVIALIVAALVPGAVVANETPLADAGLDQTVEKNATVYLDATGSRDPDGQITAFEWSITTPDGREIRPHRTANGKARFVPGQVGRYAVTVTVTDDHGATAADTLYVHVTAGAPPSITASGPRTTNTSTPATYTARATAGSAPLRTVEWQIDGRTVATADVSGSSAGQTLTKAFPTAGVRIVTAVVTDEDGQTDRQSLTTRVVKSYSPQSRTTTRSQPVIRGGQLFTGSGPFTDTYRVDGGGQPERITWWRDGVRLVTGRSTAIDWNPGEHQLFAVLSYGDGTSTVARFSDDTSTVVVDPKPAVTFDGISGSGGISGTAHATDEFRNLKRIQVSVDDEVIASRSVSALKLRQQSAGGQLDVSFSKSDIVPEREYTVTVRATDYRGQEAVITRTIIPTGQPEIVSAEFVNGPVDSYHPRIDPERYAAHHVLRVDLNGEDPKNVDIRLEPRSKSVQEIHAHEFGWYRVVNNDDILVFHSYWAGEEPDEYEVYARISSGDTKNIKSSAFEVTPSPPELRMDVLTEGTEPAERNWGITVDASGSFDPDGTELSYIWKKGAQPITADNETAKFDSLDRAGLILRDGHGLESAKWISFHDYYNPGISEIEEVTEGPYKPNETVRFRVVTNSYKFTKNTYNKHVSLGLTVTGDVGTVTKWQKRNTGYNWIDRDKRDRDYYVGTIEFEASDLADSHSTPNAVLFNRGEPGHTKVEKTIPDVTVLEKRGEYLTDVKIEELSYFVEEPIYDKQRTPYEWERDLYLADGYQIADTRLGTKYVLEKREKVQPAKYTTETRSFKKPAYRRLFLDLHPEWTAGGTETEVNSWTTTEYEWRDSRGGPGRFTGQTRRVKTQPAKYRTLRQYEYEIELEKTGTRVVTRKKTIEIRRVEFELESQCNVFLGCFTVRRPHTVTERRTISFQREITYTYTVTKERTYWSSAKRRPGHEATGNVRRIKLRNAQYETQYRYKYKVYHEETVKTYVAEHRYQTQPAQYEWQRYKTVRTELAARSLAIDPDVRIGKRLPARTWILTKQVGARYVWKDSPQDPSNVQKTKAKLSGDLTQEFRNPDTGKKYITRAPISKSITESSYMTKDRLIQRYKKSIIK